MFDEIQKKARRFDEILSLVEDPAIQADHQRYAALMTQFDELVDQFNRASDGTVAIDVEYLLVVASKP